MGFLDNIFGKKKSSKKKLYKAKSGKVVKLDGVQDVATLSYGYHVIPVDALITGVKKGGLVQALCPKSNTMIPLKDLGEELLLFDPKTGIKTSFVNYKGEEFKDLYNYIYHGERL